MYTGGCCAGGFATGGACWFTPVPELDAVGIELWECFHRLGGGITL